MKILTKSLLIYSCVIILVCVIFQIQYFWHDFFKFLIFIFVNFFVFYLIYISVSLKH